MPTTPSTNALVAHLLRRTSFGPFPGQVAPLAALGIQGAIDRVLSAAPIPVGTEPDLSDDSSDAPIRWWYGRMVDRNAGLHEKMTWFWHGLVTVSHEKVFWWQVEWGAHLILRQFALGKYRQLLRRITSEPAMLLYLDGDWSTVQGPNENYARELQELFTIGQPNIQQVNVANGARALAGWHVDWEGATSEFIDESWSSMGIDERVAFLGQQVYRYSTTQSATRRDVIDAACDHPATAPFIADKAWRYLVGTAPGPAKLATIAAAYRNANLDNRVLVERIVRDPAFLNKRHTRAKYPVEWVASAMSAAGLQQGKGLAMDYLRQMGQLPFYPPSVAGWPTGDRWLSPSLALSRAALATETPAITAIADAADPVAAALSRCNLYEVTDQTRLALTQARNALSDRAERAAVLLALCLASPEFALA